MTGPALCLSHRVMIKLEPVASAADGGSAEFELTYRRMDNTEGKSVKAPIRLLCSFVCLYLMGVVLQWVSLAPPAVMSEGLDKALVLQQFVAEVRCLVTLVQFCGVSYRGFLICVFGRSKRCWTTKRHSSFLPNFSRGLRSKRRSTTSGGNIATPT